jgi:CHAT domain-containing protein/predicted negative regulator of RcsB-dependent stress response
MGSAAEAATATRGHRIVLVLLAIAATACGPPAPDQLYAQADQYRKQDELKLALAAADDGFRREPSWRFRILKADILLASRRAKDALNVLDAPQDSITPEQRARISVDRALAAYLLADFAGAQTELDHARALAAPLRSPPLDADIALRQSAIQIRQGRLAEADATLRDVLKIAANLNDAYLTGAAAGNLGVMFMNQSRYEEAVYWLDRARASFEALRSSSGIARATGNLGWCYHRLGDDEKALAYLRQAQAGFHAAGNRHDEQIWLGNIGDVFLTAGDDPQAASAFQQALALARDIGDQYWMAMWLSDLATVSISRKDFDAAQRYNDEAIEIRRRNPSNPYGFYPRLNQAMIAAGRKDFTQAEQLYRAEIASPSDDQTPGLEAESGLADLLIQKGEMPRAAVEFRAAIARIEQQRVGLKQDESKLSYLSSLIRFYQHYVDFLVSQNQPEKALEAAEASRARLLEERLGGSRERPLDLNALRNLAARSHAVLVSYWLAPERSFVWTISARGVEMHTLPAEKEIGLLVERYGGFIQNLRDPLDSESPTGRRLAKILLGPIDADRIIVVPDRALHSLNFETLPDPKDASHYLIDRVTVEIAPSLESLLHATGAAPAESSMLVIGDPEPAADEYPRLPYAGKEIDLIAQGIPSARRVVLQGAAAYPAAYRESDPSRFGWIHFAAHAASNAEDPLDSALILSRRDAGYTLTARDIMHLPLHADLVTLSACRSAGSRTYSGEGLVGLAWAFLRAGAKNVVAGLWDVTDMSTASLMADFYTQMENGAPPADALRSAKRKLIHSQTAYRKPFYWAPFQLYTGSPATREH